MSLLHLCSFVIHVHPQRRAQFLQHVTEVSGAEVHALEEGGKGILTLEADREDELARHMEALRALPGVLALSLVYHHREIETTDQRE